MATVLTTTYSNTAAITFDISSLGTSSTFVAGRESTQIDNTSNLYVDAQVYVLGITGHASTAPTVGQVINLYCWGSEVSLATTAIDVLDGTDSAETLGHVSVLQSLRLAGSAAVTVAVGGVSYNTGDANRNNLLDAGEGRVAVGLERFVSLGLDRRGAAAERERFDELRYERAELRSPVRLATTASALGMQRGDVSEFVAVPPELLAQQIAAAGAIDDPVVQITIDTDPLDQFRAVKSVTEQLP